MLRQVSTRVLAITAFSLFWVLFLGTWFIPTSLKDNGSLGHQSSAEFKPPTSTTHDPSLEPPPPPIGTGSPSLVVDKKPSKSVDTTPVLPVDTKSPSQVDNKPELQTVPEAELQTLLFPDQFRTFHVPDDIVYSEGGPQPDQVVLLMGCDGQGHLSKKVPHVVEIAMENRKKYAELHGYHFHFINVTKYDMGGANMVWSKLPAIVDTFNKFPSAQWVWWLDLDALIMTPEIDLNSHLFSYSAMYDNIEKGMELKTGGDNGTGLYTSLNVDVEKIDIIISQDHNGLNAGSFFIRRSTTAKWIMDLWADPAFVNSGWEKQEQEALMRMVLNHESVRTHVGFVAQRAINAYAEGGNNMRWFPGDLVVHFAGCWVQDKCAEFFEKFWSKIRPENGGGGMEGGWGEKS